MIRLLALLGDKVVVVSNDSTLCRFEQIAKESPLRGYYDGMFNYSFTRRMQVRKQDSIRQIDSMNFPFNALVGVTIEQNGEVYTHLLTLGEDEQGNKISQQIGDFQGTVHGITNSWFGGDTYTVNALSMVWDQFHKLDPDVIFSVLEPSVASSTNLTIATIKKDALLKSIEMMNAGMSYNDIESMWTIETFYKPTELKLFGLDDVQEFNAQNLSQLTAYHTLPEQPID